VERVDAIVVGAGIVGTATARALAGRGAACVLLEQFELGHVRGSSHGPGRVFRLAYPQPDYVALAARALRSWRKLEDAAGEELLVTTGGVYAGEWAERCAEGLASRGVRHEWLAAEEAAERFAGLSLDGLDQVLWQPDGGVCRAGRAVAALARVAGEQGAQLREHEEVTRLALRDGAVEVETASGTLRAPVAVVAAGAWAGPLLREAGIELPLSPVFAQVTYFGAADAGAELPPSFIEAGRESLGLGAGGYWIPSLDGQLQIRAGDGAPGRPLDPGEGPFPVDPEEEGWVSDFVQRRLPAFDPTPQSSETCIYTMTPDEDFVLDRAGPLVVGSACSGHGFKFGPLLGEILADLALGRDPGIPEARFSLSRFVR
jgi:sarcosine oxidase